MKKLMALVLSVAMVICALPAAIFADDAATTPETDIKDAVITAIDDQEYTGDEIKIAEDKLVVKVGETTLKADTDYTVAYKNNTNVGKATVTVTGKGAYKGTVSADFKIVKHFTDTDKPVITIPTQNVSDQTTLKNVTVEWNGSPAIQDKHYTITDVDNSKAGTQTATFTFTGGYFFGEYKVNYNVVDKDISNASLYLDDLNATYTFDGTGKTPAVTIKSGNVTLVNGTDYIVKYENNVNAGTATIKVIGAGTYAGELTKTFTINKAKLSDCVITFDPDAYTSTGTAITPKYTVKLSDYTLKAEEYTAAYTNNVNVGEATATLTAANKNFTGTLTGKFIIAGKAVADLDCTLAAKEIAYDGTAKEPTVTVKEGTVTLSLGTDYTVKYENNVNAGTAKAIISGAGKYAGTKTLEFTIKGKANSITAKDSYTKYLTSKVFNLEAKGNGDETGLTYVSSDDSVVKVTATGDVEVVGTGKATITVSTVGTKESDPATKDITVTVKPLKPVFKLTTPAKKQIKVQITKVKGATKYEVRYGRSGKYYIRTVKHIDSKYTKTSTTIKKRLSGKTYFVKVRSVKVMENGTVVYGNWSNTQKIKAR